ncbi:cytochrome c oxidase assembly protein [Arthrobacter sp. NamB2]|uniref:cytochrome c oxidase assembly protein n=1 Tax=Arthrobacter sp. NamB2 TaxID=2576035 RepID=UPI0016763CF2|nr:cytochrome c oxidase assembly protein [Arthrobacter sp. NamB2]
MTDSSHHPGGTGLAGGDPSGFVADTAVALVWIGLAVLYLLAGRAAALRGRDDWKARRTLAWSAGAGLGLAVTVGPVADAAAGSFTVHTAVHLVLGMLVPLLLVLGAPVSLFLRAVPVDVGRRFSRLLRAAPLRLLTHPVVATLLNTLPMAFLYWDGTGLTMLHDPVIGPLLHLHFVASGTLFTYAVVGLDPNPHRAPAWLRGSMIGLSIAVHGIVAKHLYAVGDRDGQPADTEQAAQLMYYGGDSVHVLLLVVFCAQVYGRAHSGIPSKPRAHP